MSENVEVIVAVLTDGVPLYRQLNRCTPKNVHGILVAGVGVAPVQIVKQAYVIDC